MRLWVFNSLDIQIILAIIIDLVIGDPQQLPHIVVYYGKIINYLEKQLNQGQQKILKGLIGVAILLALVAVFSFIVDLASRKLIISGQILTIWLMSSTLAVKSLVDHTLRVYYPLAKNDLPKARRFTSLIVGRDTEQLNQAEITRAVVETIAENTVDGVTAPLFYLLIFGLPGALIYKAINTLDSMWGYRNQRFYLFGRIAAILDDLANYIPARLTAICIIIASAIFPEFNARRSLQIIFRDSPKHPSPNSGIAEAGFAGAMGVCLGGTNYYQGQVSERGVLGDKLVQLNAEHIKLANKLMLATSMLFAITGLILRVVLW